MKKDEFLINTTGLMHVAGSEDDVSHTIEELLGLNDLIPARTENEINEVTEIQLDKSKYINKPSRGEVDEVTEIQFGKREDPKEEVQEIRLETTTQSEGGHHEKAWNTVNEKMRGHQSIQPAWLDIFKREDKRKGFDKGRINKKLPTKK